MISSKDMFLHQQIIESQERLRRAKTMSRDERYALRDLKLFEQLETFKIKDEGGKTGTVRLSK